MKSTTISAATIALLASLTSAAPTTQAVVRVQLETEIETFVQDTIPFNVLFKTTNNRRLDSGLEAKIVGTTGISDSSKVSCQAFDANNQPLGAPFTTVNEGVFSTNGQPVPIDAYLCSNMGGNVVAVETQSSTTARIELEFDSDGFRQEEIPIGQLVLTKNVRRLRKGIDASVVSATGVEVKTVKCQAFSDEQATQPLGDSFTNTVRGIFTTDASNPVPIAAIKCDSN